MLQRFIFHTSEVNWSIKAYFYEKRQNYYLVKNTVCPFLETSLNQLYVVRNAGCARSRYTRKLSLVFLNQSIN